MITYQFYQNQPIFIEAKFKGNCNYPLIFTDDLNEPGYFEISGNEVTIKYHGIGIEYTQDI